LAAVLVFLAGAGGVGWYALRQASEARHAEELALARGFARPLGQREATAPLSDTELDALWKLAESDSDRVRVLFFHEALAEPEVAERVARRAAHAVQAAVGLDEGRRQQALQVVRRRSKATPPDPRVKQACIEIGAALGDDAWVRAALEESLSALNGAADTSAVEAQARRLTTLAAAVDSDGAADAAARILAVLGKTRHPEAFPGLGKALTRFAERMRPDQARAVAFAGASAQLGPWGEWGPIHANDPGFPELLRARREFMKPLADRLTPDEAAVAARRTVEWLAQFSEEELGLGPNPLPGRLLEALAVLRGRLTPAEAQGAARQALDALRRAPNSLARRGAAFSADVLAAPAGGGAGSASLRLAAKVALLREGLPWREERAEPPGGARDAEKRQREELAALAAELNPGEAVTALEQALDALEPIAKAGEAPWRSQFVW